MWNELCISSEGGSKLDAILAALPTILIEKATTGQLVRREYLGELVILLIYKASWESFHLHCSSMYMHKEQRETGKSSCVLKNGSDTLMHEKDALLQAPIFCNAVRQQINSLGLRRGKLSAPETVKAGWENENRSQLHDQKPTNTYYTECAPSWS